MRWDRDHRSDDVVDQRGAGGGGGPMGAGVGILFWLVSRFGLPGLLLGGAVLAVGYFLSPSAQEGDQRAVGPNSTEARGAADDPAHFVGFVLDDVQGTWTRLFAERGRKYTPAKLVLFTQSTRSGCGYGDAQVGPFYCPVDSRVYIDLGFYRELDRLGAPGDFAQAYVIAHEIGHHVQNLLGIQKEAQTAARGGQNENQVSIAQELQADCFAGVWAHFTNQRNVLQAGDIEEGLRAASAIGDDKLQERAEGRVRPEKWTHGSSEQRVTWFKRGYQSGAMDDCNTLKLPAR